MHTRNHSDLIISASGYYCFIKNIYTCVLNPGQDKEILLNMENSKDMEGQVLNQEEIPVEIYIENQDTEKNSIWKIIITHTIS